jgi:molecular chaperone GrpE (heat shock protein)
MTVVGVARTGYRLHERILRPAQVIVSASADKGR